MDICPEWSRFINESTVALEIKSHNLVLNTAELYYRWITDTAEQVVRIIHINSSLVRWVIRAAVIQNSDQLQTASVHPSFCIKVGVNNVYLPWESTKPLQKTSIKAKRLQESTSFRRTDANGILRQLDQGNYTNVPLQ